MVSTSELLTKEVLNKASQVVIPLPFFVILSPSHVILSRAKNLVLWLRTVSFDSENSIKSYFDKVITMANVISDSTY
jgi:hypothetical protein